VFSSTADFEQQILQDPGFVIYVLKPNHVQDIAGKLGALKPQQVYIPQPYPFAGGDESVGSYQKGNLWIMLDIVSQFRTDCG